MYLLPETAHRQLEQARDGLIVIRDLASSATNKRDIALSPEQLASVATLISDQISSALDSVQWNSAYPEE